MTTVSHEHLRAHLRVVDTSPDDRARHAEGQIPVGFTPEPYGIETSGRGLQACIAIAIGFSLLVTAGWLGYLGMGWMFGWVIG